MPAKWIVEIEIADDWILDGCRLDAGEIAEAIDRHYFQGLARTGEVKCRLIATPSQHELDAIEERYDEAQLEYCTHYSS